MRSRAGPADTPQAHVRELSVIGPARWPERPLGYAISPGPRFGADPIADAYWAIHHDEPAACHEKYRFEDAPDPSVIAASRVTT
jgi:hypothetical protein